MIKGMNLQNMKQSNRSGVLYLLNEYKVLSRKQIASLLHLTKAAVSKITQQLINEGQIEEKETIESGVGPKEVLLSLRFDDAMALGITFERDEITFSVASLNGIPEDITVLPFDADFDNVLTRIKDYYFKKKSHYRIIGAGVSIIGSLRDYGIYPGIDIKEKLESVFDIPVYIKNNVQAFSLAQTLFGNKTDDKNILLFKWGPGIGSAFIRDGKVLSGDDFGVTEIGHMIVNPNGKKCRCGRRGCLETEGALDIIENEVHALGYPLSIGEILVSENPEIKALLMRKIDMVCLALLNACTIYNSSSVILFGSVFRREEFLKRFSERWNSLCQDLKMNMSVSSLNDRSGYIGSVALVTRKLFFEKV